MHVIKSGDDNNVIISNVIIRDRSVIYERCRDETNCTEDGSQQLNQAQQNNDSNGTSLVVQLIIIIIIILAYFRFAAYTGMKVIESPTNCDRRCVTKLVNSHRRV